MVPDLTLPSVQAWEAEIRKNPAIITGLNAQQVYLMRGSFILGFSCGATHGLKLGAELLTPSTTPGKMDNA